MKKFIVSLCVCLLIILSFLVYKDTQSNPVYSETIELLSIAHSPEKSTGYLTLIQPLASIVAPEFIWPVYHQEPGLIIYKEEGKKNNFVFVIDPKLKNVGVHNDWGKLTDQWGLATNPACVFNGTYYESDGTPTFPLIVDGQIIPGLKTGSSKYDVRILYFNQGILTVNSISSNSDVVQADTAISGLKPNNISGITNFTVIATVNNLFYVIITQDMTTAKIVELLAGLGVPEQNVVVLDGGGSTGAMCNGEELFVRDRIIAHAIIVTNP